MKQKKHYEMPQTEVTPIETENLLTISNELPAIPAAKQNNSADWEEEEEL